VVEALEKRTSDKTDGVLAAVRRCLQSLISKSFSVIAFYIIIA